MKNNAYNINKIIYHSEHLNCLRNNIQTFPIYIHFVISDLCNQDCNFCSYRMENYTSNQLFKQYDLTKNIINNNPNRMISKEKCFQILDDCKDMGVKAILFTGGGEPTVHPFCLDIFNKSLDNNIQSALTTNGVLLTEKYFDSILQFQWIRFSIDTSNKETYSKIRRVPESIFNKVLLNIKKLTSIKNNNLPIIGINFVVTKDNYKEIYDAIKIYKDLGVDNVKISAAITNDDFDYHKNHYQEIKESILIIKQKYEDKDFTIFDLFGERIQDLLDERPEYEYCGIQNLITYIGGDQNVYRCCTTSYNEHGYIGSLKEKSLKELWTSQEKIEKFNNFKANTCERCTFNSKNRIINYILEKEPLHVNFL